MGRKYPRFLLCNTTTGKSKGTFIIHTLEPQFICKPEFTDGRGIEDVWILEIWSDGFDRFSPEVVQAKEDINDWWRYSGIHDSPDPRDKVISGLSKLDFLKDATTHYTVEQAQEVIKIIFPSRAKSINTTKTSYGLKHDLERLSGMFLSGDRRKYCSNDTLKEAMKNEGFHSRQDGPNSPNEFYNITEKELNLMRKLTFYRANHSFKGETF